MHNVRDRRKSLDEYKYNKFHPKLGFFLSFIIKYKDNTWLSEHETFCLMSLSSQHLRQVFLLNYGFPRKLFKSRIIFFYFFLSA